MRALDRLKDLPDWPVRMTAPVAAAYMGVSQSTFLNRFGSIGRKEGGNTLWARPQLDRIVAEQFDLGMETWKAPAPQMSAYDRIKSGEFARADEFEVWAAEQKKR